MKVFMQDPNQKPEDFTHAYYHRDQADWDRIYKDYTAAVDWPSVTFYKDLLKKYPDAKVILTVRDADSWYNSVKNTIFETSQRILIEKPSFPSKDFDKLVEMFELTCLEGVLDKDKFGQEERIKQIFLDHNEDVKRGGNGIYVRWDGREYNLHHVWDSSIAEKWIGGMHGKPYPLAAKWANQLAVEITDGKFADGLEEIGQEPANRRHPNFTKALKGSNFSTSP